MNVICSPFRGYPDLGLYMDTEANKGKARSIMRGYWERNEPAIALVLLWDFLEPPYSRETDDQALRWCEHILNAAMVAHFHYPGSLGLTAGMQGESEHCLVVGVPVTMHEYMDEEWEAL